MENNYIDVMKRKIDSSYDLKNLKTHLLHPWLVLISKSRLIEIIDINSNNEIKDKKIETSEDIIDSVLLDDFLWMVSSSGKLTLIHLFRGSQISVEVTYKIRRILIEGHTLYFVTESEEILMSPFSSEELIDKIEYGTTQLQMSVEKIRNLKKKAGQQTCYLNFVGLNMYIENGRLVTECPITCLREYMLTESDVEFKYLANFGDTIVLADKSKMWILDVNYLTIILQFNNDEFIYKPLGSHENEFIYLLSNEEEISIHSIQKVSPYSHEISNDNFSTNITNANLHSQDMLKSQVRSLIDIVLNGNTKPEEVLLSLKSLFDQIQDLHFLVSVGAKLCQSNTFFKPILYFLQKRTAESKDDRILNELFDIIFKVEVVEYITFIGKTSYRDVNLFDQNFKELSKLFISNSDFDLASLCWLKYSALNMNVSSEDILCILDAIPHNTKIGALIVWLKNFIPALMEYNPFYVDLLVRWTSERVFLLERTAHWPKIGIKLIDEIMKVLETSSKTVVVRPISMDDLDILKDRIMYIMELKEKYKINILLGELCSLNPPEVALIMLHRCYTEDLETFLQDYLPAFATRHGFELDKILRSYVDGEANSGGGSIDGHRLNIILNTFRIPSSKLECLLCVLRVLDVPWDSDIYTLATKAAATAMHDFTSNAVDSKLAREIGEEISYANFKVILKKYNYPLTCTDFKLVIHKIVNAPNVDLNDLKTVMHVRTADKLYASILFIDRCLRDCYTKAALDYFLSLSQSEIRIVLKSIMAKYDLMITSDIHDKVVERCYIDFLKGTNLLNDNHITTIENMYHFKNSYGISLSMNEMYCERYPNENTDGTTTKAGIAWLARTRGLCKYDLIDLLQRTFTNSNVKRFVETLVTTPVSVEEVNFETIAGLLSLAEEKIDTSFLLQSCDVLINLISSCSEEHLHYLIKCLSILSAVINSTVIMKNLSTAWRFQYLYIPMSSFSTSNDLLTYFAQKSLQKVECKIIDWSDICNKSDLFCLRLVANAIENYVDQWDIVSINKNIKRHVNKIATLQDIDELMVTGLLLMLSVDNIPDYNIFLPEILKGQYDAFSPSAVAYLNSPVVQQIFGLNSNVSGTTMTYTPQFLLKSKYNITLGNFAFTDITEETIDVKIQLFYVLKMQPDIPLDCVIDLCQVLNIALDDGLSLQLIARLTTWELKYYFTKDDFGRQTLYVENNENLLLTDSTVLWESIKNKEFLSDILKDFWINGEVSLHGHLISINPYYYEVYLCIFYLLHAKSECKSTKEYFLLNFLKNYKRRSSPQQYEFELFSIKGMFPEIGHYRLPFHLFVREDMWSNLKSEITLESYELWLPAVALLSLDNDLQTAKDMICSNALKQTMKARKFDSSEADSINSETWRLSAREEPLLRAAHRCVKHIANMEWAGACLFYVLQGCSRGADQVAAAHLCYQFAKLWDEWQPGNRAVRKMEYLHSTLSTRHILHKIEWATDELLQLLTEPVQLIRAMYFHPSFIEKMSRHDVNGAINEIAEKNGINISTIRMQILENILEKNHDIKNKNLIGLESKELVTAKYIFKATCPKMGAIYLSRIAFDQETDFNKYKQLRALQCLMSIVDPDTALKVTNRERDVLWESLLELFYVINLVNIEMPWAVGSFIHDKSRVLEQLIPSVGNNTNGLKLAAEIAAKYCGEEVIVKLIPLLLRATLYEDLIPLLLKILTPPNELIRAAWRAVLLSPFKSADYPISEKQRVSCIKVANLLPMCPVICDDDLKEIWRNCIRCKCYGLGCLVLPYMTEETRASLNELKKIDKRNLIVSLKNLQSETYLVSGAMHVIENMLPKLAHR